MSNAFETISLGYPIENIQKFLMEEDNVFQYRSKYYVEDKIETGFNLFQAAAGFDRCDVMDVLAKRQDFSIRYLNYRSNLTGNTPLLHAIRFDNLRVVQWLLAAGALVNQTNYEWKNELNQVFTFPGEHALSIAQALVKKGCNIHHRDREGDTPLVNLIKSQKASKELILFCLNQKVEIDDNVIGEAKKNKLDIKLLQSI